MCFIFKLNQPSFRFPIDGDGRFNGASIDFLAFVQVVDLSALFQHFCADHGHIHQGDGPVRLTVHLIPASQIFFQCFFYRSGNLALFHFDGTQPGRKRGMAAVVAPVCVNHTQFCHRGIALFFVTEIVPAEQQIVKTHGKAHGTEVSFHFFVIPLGKARSPSHIGRHICFHIQGFRFLHAGHAGFHGVNQIRFDFFHFGIGQIALYRNHAGRGYPGTFTLGEQLYALGRRVRPLVILAGQIFHGKHAVPVRELHVFGVHIVHIRFTQNGAAGFFKLFFIQAFHIVAIKKAHIRNSCQSQIVSEIRHHMFGFHCETGLLFHKYSDNHICLSILPLSGQPIPGRFGAIRFFYCTIRYTTKKEVYYFFPSYKTEKTVFSIL